MKRYNLLASMFALAFSGCMASVESDEPTQEIEASSQALFAISNTTGALWPNGRVTVCWDDSAANNAPSFHDFAAYSQYIKDVAVSTWTPIANVEFLGWGVCSSTPRPYVKLRLFDNDALNTEPGYPGPTGANIMSIGVNAQYFWFSGIVHEFGHALGFRHETARDDFTDDTSGFCREGNFTGGNKFGTPANDRDSIMVASYCNFDIAVPTRWDRVGMRSAYGTRADTVVVAQNGTRYARKASDSKFYRLSGSTWLTTGRTGGQFATAASVLYSLSSDGSAVYQYSGSGTTWTQIGAAASQIFDCAGRLCATTPREDATFRYQNGAWVYIGGQATQYASTLLGLFRLNADRTAVEAYTGGSSWTKISERAGMIVATNNALYGTNAFTGEIFRYNGSPNDWTFIGPPGRRFVSVGNTLYRVSLAGDAVFRYDGGTTWTKVGDDFNWLYGSRATTLYGQSNSGTMFQFTGNQPWLSVSMP